MGYKLMAIDMDGTLLNSKNRISNRTKNAIKLANNKGIYTVLATGRMLRSARNYANKIGIKTPIICSNGSVLVDEFGRVLYGEKLDYKTVEDVMKISKEEETYSHVYGLEEIYAPIKLQEIIDFYNDEDTRKEEYININIFNSISDLKKMGSPNLYKFLFIDPYDNKKGHLDRVSKRLNDLGTLDISSSWSNNLEVTPKGVSKGKTLNILANELEVKKEEIIVIGDNYNDLSMFDVAGYSVAMGNAEEKVKKKADKITATNDEDGVAKIIEKYLI